MTVGLPTDKMSVDNAVGNLARQIQVWSGRVPDFKAWLDTISDDDLTKPPFGYTSSDVAILRSATNDMLELAQVYLGMIDHTPASDMSVFVRRLSGVPAYPTMIP